MEAPLLDGKKLVIVPILRAGLGLAEGVLDLVPLARMGHVGLYRDPRTLQAVEYYFKIPGYITDRDVIVCDPMLATAHSAIAAVDRLKETGARRIKMICILAAEPGARAFAEVHPDVPVFTAAVDAKLNDHGYIVPGLGTREIASSVRHQVAPRQKGGETNDDLDLKYLLASVALTFVQVRGSPPRRPTRPSD